MNDYFNAESVCEKAFDSLREVYHLWTPENHEILFTSDSDYHEGMNIIGVAAKLYPDVRILTFEIMSNHIHIAAASSEERLMEMFDAIRVMLQRWLKMVGSSTSLKGFVAKTRLLESLQDTRNVIIYDNRNGFVVHPEHTPFTYPWGANRYYFSPDSCRLARNGSKLFTLRKIRMIAHSRQADGINGLMHFDDYALPLSFCDIDTGMALFRDASHYFHMLSKSIESNVAIAKEIGESICYNDDELFLIVLKLCREKFSASSPKMLGNTQKLTLAKLLHYDYNAGAKQIQRLLKIDRSILQSLGI